jgi:lysophospholipid acyltransferase (LPLAT)-like uncharacterized protein
MRINISVIILITIVLVACKKTKDSGENIIPPPPPVSTTFKGNAGVYCLGQGTDVAINPLAYTNPGVVGVVLKATWDKLEPTPGNFDFTFLDGKI